MKRTVHRLNAKLLSFKLHRREHWVGIVLFVPAHPPQITLRNVRRKNEAIAAGHELFAEIIFHLFANGSAFGVPEYQSLAVGFLNRKEIQFSPKPAMIPLLGFLPLL